MPAQAEELTPTRSGHALAGQKPLRAACAALAAALTSDYGVGAFQAVDSGSSAVSYRVRDCGDWQMNRRGIL